jgi:hypothetical protein
MDAGDPIQYVLPNGAAGPGPFGALVVFQSLPRPPRAGYVSKAAVQYGAHSAGSRLVSILTVMDGR